MKNYKINPNKISNLVNIAANLYTLANDDVGYSPQRGEKATQMHFVAELLKDLVETAYPIEEELKKDLPRDMLDAMVYGLDKATGEGYTVITALDLDFKSFEEGLQKVKEIIKDIKPPRAGEF